MYRTMACIVWLAFASTTAFAAPSAPPIEDYAKNPATDWVKLSPSGDRYAYVGLNGDKPCLFVATISGGPPEAIDIGPSSVINLNWAGDDLLLVSVTGVTQFGQDFGSRESRLTQVMAYDIKDHTALKVFEHHESQVMPIVEGRFGEREVNGRWYGYFGGFNQERSGPAQGAGGFSGPTSREDLYQVDLDSGDIKMLSHGSDNESGWLVGPSGDVLARYQSEWGNGAWRVLAGSEGDKILLSGRSKLAGGQIWPGRGADEMLVARPPDADGLPIYEQLPVSGGVPTVAPDSDSISSPLFDRLSGLWIGYVATDDGRSAHFFDPAVEAKMRSVRNAFPDRTVELKSWSQDFSKFIVFVTGSGESGTYYLVDLTAGKADPVGYAFPTVGADQVGPISMIDYKANDGTPLRAVLSLPPGTPAKNLPLIVMPLGAVKVRDYPRFDALAQALASRGYAVVQPNARGSSGYGSAFVAAGFGQVGGKIQSDISDVVKTLAQRGVADPQRVCIVGTGWGGYAAAAGVTIQHGIYRCAVAMNAAVDLVDFQAKSGPLRDETDRSRYFWQLVGHRSPSEISPIKHANSADAPILLIYENDKNLVIHDENESMAAALRRDGKPVAVVSLRANVDAAVGEADRIATYKATVAFVEKYNPSSEPVATAAR